ncbi:MAG: isochorismatase family protein [Deltaproteobacteria bacterium]|nr:isochorismatase family protein [Deltaproteobacteria bacterium]
MENSRVLNREQAVLVVIDVQERLVAAIDQALYERARRNVGIAIEAVDILGLPILVTEQYPKGLGRTVAHVLAALAGKQYELIEKIAFSCAREERFLSALTKTGRGQVILTGMECHVCVYQTALDLLNAGFEVFVPEDAVSSRHPSDHQGGIAAMRDAGVRVVPTETAVFQLLKAAGTPEFKKISSLLR